MKNHPASNATGRVDLLPHPAQSAFLEAKRIRLVDGTHAYRRYGLFSGRRGGKTRIGAIGAADELAIPNSLGWACAPSYPELQDYVIPAVFAAVPEAWIADWIASRFLLKLKNGAECAFRSLDDPERGRGPGLDWLWIDEARKVAERAWDTVLPALSDKRGIAWITTSPNGFDWCHRRFWTPAINGQAGFWAVKYKTSDNPKIDQEEIDNARRELDPLFFQQEYEGEFVSFTGAIYGTLLDTQILMTDRLIREVLPEYPNIDPTRSAIIGMDPGADHPFGAVLIVATEAGLVVCGEHHKRNKAAYDHAIDMRAMCRGLHPERWAIDRSQKQMAIELSQHGIYATAANNDVVSGINRVQSWLRTKKLWFIEPWCPRTVEHLRNYQWAENVGLDGGARREQVKKVLDDLPDALRYALMLWPELPSMLTRDEPDDVTRFLRDLETVPEPARWQVERMRKIDRQERGEDLSELDEMLTPVDDSTQHGTGDFYA